MCTRTIKEPKGLWRVQAPPPPPVLKTSVSVVNFVGQSCSLTSTCIVAALVVCVKWTKSRDTLEEETLTGEFPPLDCPEGLSVWYFKDC